MEPGSQDFPGQIPDKLVIAEELKGNVIDLEGHELIAVELGHTDTEHTMAFNSILSSRTQRSDRSALLRSTRLSRSNHGQLSPPLSDPRTTTIPGLLKRPASTFAISTVWQELRKPLKSFTKGCWNYIRTGSIPVGHSGSRLARLSHSLSACEYGLVVRTRHDSWVSSGLTSVPHLSIVLDNPWRSRWRATKKSH